MIFAAHVIAPRRALSKSSPEEMGVHAGQHWGVIGGGMLGMALARELKRDGAHVTLCEAAPHAGGLASSWQVGPVTWDRHYHVTLLSDTALRGLLTDLGLEKEIHWTRTKTGFFVDGKLYSMSDALEFLRFPPLSLFNKLRLGATIFYASRVKRWERLEHIPVEDWLRRLSGSTTFAKIWRPLLLSKLGESYRDVSAAFIWTTISRLYAARRAGMKHELFGYVPGGYARILARLAGALRDDGIELRLNAQCKQVRKVATGVQVDFADGGTEEFDRVVLTVPAPIASAVCPDLTRAEHDLLNGIRYQGIVCASLVLKRPLGVFYVTNITDAGIPFTGVIEMSVLVDRDQFGGHHLVYLPKYVPPGDPAFCLSDEQLREQFVAGLARMYPGFSDDDVIAFKVSRARHVFALPTLGYSSRLPPVRTSIPGVHILNSAHIVNGTLNVNETLMLAQRAKAELS